MIILQTSPEIFNPITSLTGVFVRDFSTTPTPVAHRRFNFNNYAGGAGHYEYLAAGVDIESLTVHSADPADSVDLSALPTIRRMSGIDAEVRAKFTNGRGISGEYRLQFDDLESPSYLTGPISTVADGYGEYSLGRVRDIFDNLTSPAMFDGSGNRAHTSTIPHASFTGHVYSVNGGARGGMRFTAVTPRHVIGCAHYGYQVGDVLGFRTVTDEMVYRTVIEVWNPNVFTPGYTVSDFQIFLLDSALPSSISPVPIVGEWFTQLQSGATDGTLTHCPQHVGITLWNNDGHMTPVGHMASADVEFNNYPTRTADTVEITARGCELLREPYATTIIGEEDLDYSLPANPFYHARRAGDSGSPSFAPVDSGWAMCAIISGRMWNEDKLNAAIARVDAAASVSTGYTVTVAPDPTL